MKNNNLFSSNQDLSRLVNENVDKAVNARMLHAYLGVGKDFSSWFKAQIKRCDLIEDTDYQALTLKVENSNGIGYSHRTEYALTLDAAKEVSMMSQTEKGKVARRYFIECEKRLKSQSHSPLPMFLQRYILNENAVPYTYFSVINAIYTEVYKALEHAGYVIPDNTIKGTVMCPEVSVGKTFARYLRDQGSDLWEKRKTYTHRFGNGRTCKANMYPIEVYHLFVRFIHEVWLPTKAPIYFKTVAPEALTYLPKLLN